MRVLRFLPCLCVASVLAGNVRLDRPLPVPSPYYYLRYDDGIAYWLNWSGTYRGTWFDVEDFIPAPSSWITSASQLWFYHDPSYPWDTSSFYCELWNGGIGAPISQLDQTTVSAVHYGPCYADYGSGIATDVEFWVIINTEISSGGWPSVLGDNTPGADHSFFSDDFMVWEPWLVQGPTANDYFIRSEFWWPGLDAATWGSIKTLF